MSLDDAMQTFIIECRELLESMEAALLSAEEAPASEEAINAIFRAAHTIKGSAGLFGLDHIVSFVHVAESVLDKVRNNEIPLDPPLVALMLQVCDHIGLLVSYLEQFKEPDNDLLEGSAILQAGLSTYLSDTPQPSASTLPVEHDAPYESEGGTPVETDNWHLSLRFNQDVLRNGMDPLSFIRYLGTLGKIVSIVTLTDTLPPLDAMDPETCYLGFEISFSSTADKADIESVFDFVREGSQIHILPPRSKISEYIQLIQSMPADDMRLGELLIKCGTLTRQELEDGLASQRTVESPDQVKPIGEVLIEQNVVQPVVVAAALDKQKAVKDVKTAEASLIRVDANKLDQLINLVGELIIASSGASLIAQKEALPHLLESTSTISRLVETIRDSALSLRMVPIGGTFSKFKRVVRDVSAELGKDIQLEISGEETELDKTVVEKIGDPLTHLVRNSMDHGIEPAEVRLARGKPVVGTLKLDAYHDSGNIIIEVSDDGGGLNKDKIFAKAVERGLIKPDQIMSENEIYNLIFEPGFSTADAVSNLSGRGVGMDVVRRNIEALRGTVEIRSVLGEGATMRIRLPLTLAIIDGFLVEVGDSSYVVPLDMVIECIELPVTQAGHDAENDADFINLRGEVLPYLRLRKHFEINGEPPRRENVVVVQFGDRKMGIVVDHLMGELQTVIKPLGKVLNKIRGIGGFTILGSGRVALIVDVPSMMQEAEHAAHEHITQKT
ncbi:chemotaxis protein CheA [Methylovorus menthalis]|uniref:chemotaxis protein CheA n=1 Tax=Methylovorus menthalis TaxID=1002227 RepID=UPI001E35360F|nr:chemotaxis protein CheA [Methylovorus menthalis]MCB4809996.1 chemotaxis protein CheA [Methylovorus menthalis]